MESYIEISFLHNVLVILLSVLLGEYAALQPVSFRRLLGYAVSISFVACFCWFPHSVYVVLVAEMILFVLFFRYAYKSYLMGLCIRYLCYYTAFAFYQGGFHNLVWFVPMKSGILFLWGVYGAVYILLALKWKDIFSKLSYLYQIRIYVEGKVLHLPAYLDSANLVTYHHVPILFIDKKYHEYFKNQRIELVVMNTIAKTEIIRCYACDVQIAGCRKHAVYVNCDKTLQLPFQCNVLLNMKVMTLG